MPDSKVMPLNDVRQTVIFTLESRPSIPLEPGEKVTEPSKLMRDIRILDVEDNVVTENRFDVVCPDIIEPNVGELRRLGMREERSQHERRGPCVELVSVKVIVMD